MVRILHVSRGRLTAEHLGELRRIAGETAEIVHVDASAAAEVVAALRPGAWSAVYASGVQRAHRELLNGLNVVELVQVREPVPQHRSGSFRDRFVTFGFRTVDGVVACDDAELETVTPLSA